MGSWFKTWLILNQLLDKYTIIYCIYCLMVRSNISAFHYLVTYVCCASCLKLIWKSNSFLPKQSLCVFISLGCFDLCIYLVKIVITKEKKSKSFSCCPKSLMVAKPQLSGLVRKGRKTYCININRLNRAMTCWQQVLSKTVSKMSDSCLNEKR